MISRKDFLKKAGLGVIGGSFGLKELNQASFPKNGSSIINSEISFWDIFSNDFRKNCLSWQHCSHNPVIPATGNSWKMHWTANPDFLKFRGKQLLYYRGNGILPNSDGLRHDRIAVAEVLSIDNNSFKFKDLNDGNFIINVGKKGSFDDAYVLDPAAIIFKNRVYLYYSGLGAGGNSVGLAISEDGVHFHKYGRISNGHVPSIIEKDGLLYLLRQIKKPGVGYVGFYMATSDDGIHFKDMSENPVFTTQVKGGWDNQITTGRLFKQGSYYYLFYGGNTSLVDQPDYFGLARSKDIIHWERHPGNPIFGCGPKGAEDGGAMWFPALFDGGDYYHILYEGSRGNYAWQLSSQICLASLKKEKL